MSKVVKMNIIITIINVCAYLKISFAISKIIQYLQIPNICIYSYTCILKHQLMLSILTMHKHYPVRC